MSLATAEDAHKAFASWRKKQTFATPELADHARRVEFDLERLTRPAGRFPAMRQAIAENIASFEAALRAASTTA